MLTAAIIGAGSMAREHISSLRRLGNVNITTVCDLSEARAEATAERYGIEKWYLDYEVMLRETRPDIVHIVTPPETHFRIARAALAENINVFCEKPIASTYQEFKVLRELATRVGRLLVENQNYRFHTSVVRMKELFAHGMIGEITDIQVFIGLRMFGADEERPALENLKGGIIGDFLPHIAYLSLMFLGPIRDVHSVWKKLNSNSLHRADEFRGLVSGSKIFGFVGFSGNAHSNGFWLRVQGNKMAMEANLFEPPRLVIKRRRVAENALDCFLDGISESRQVMLGTFGGLWRKLAGTSSYDGLDDFISSTYLALQGRQPPPVTLDQIEEAILLVGKFTDSLVES
jgi:predicted dehydrogenase